MFGATCLDINGNTLSHLTQWDIGQKVMFSDLDLTSEPVVYFYNRMLKDDEAVSVLATTDSNGNVIVDIPNFLLQKPYPIAVRICDSEKNTITTRALSYISVRAANKPNNYKYVENVNYTTLNVFYSNVYAEIQKIIYGIKDGSPKGVYTDSAELNGKSSGVYINANDGYIYYWNGTTLSERIIQYQSTGIADGSVTFNLLSDELQSKYRNHVLGFKSPFSFDIDIDENGRMSVIFVPDGEARTASLLWGNNIYCSIFDLSQAFVECESSLIDSDDGKDVYKHIMLMYSPTRTGSATYGFYWLELNNELAQVTNDDFVVMLIYVKNGVIRHIIACDDVLNKIVVNGEKYTNIDSIEEAVQSLQNNLQASQEDIQAIENDISTLKESSQTSKESIQAAQEDIQAIENRFNSTYRNHVIGFRSSFDFYINTELQEVTFTPENTSVIYGNNTSAYIYKLTETVDGTSVTGTYTASYAEFLSGTQTTNIIMLIYSPNAEIRKSAFYFKQFDKNQITNDDYVVMILRINQDGVLYAVACDDILDKIYVGKGDTYTKHINPDSIQEAIMNAQGQIADNAEAIANRLNKDTFDSAYRNHVRGFKSSYNFYINTDVSGRFVTFKPSTTSTMWGNNIFANIPAITEKVGEETVVHEYTASYSEFLSGTQSNIIMLMYSPTYGSTNNDISVRKSAFYFKPFNYSQVTDNDYVIMVLYVNTAGVAYVIACDDVLNRVYVGKGTDVSSYTPYTVDVTAATEAIESELSQARYSYYDNNTHESLAKHLYYTDTALKNHIIQYRNYCRSYVGNLSLTINTDINNLETGNTILFKALNTGIVYGNNSYINIPKKAEGYDEVNYWNLISPFVENNPSSGGIFCLLWSVSNRKFYAIKYSSDSIPESPNDPVICTVYVSVTTTKEQPTIIKSIDVVDIAACDTVLKSIVVNNYNGGIEDTSSWIKEIASTPYNLNTCAIFDRVCCIGDSATAGHIDYGYTSDGTLSTDVQIRRNEKFAWAAFMAKLTGNEYINLGISGATALTWLDGTSDATDDGASFNNIDKTIRVKAKWLATAYDESGSLIEGAFERVEEKTDENGNPKKYIVYERTVENTDTISAYLIGLGMNDTSNASTANGNYVDDGSSEDAKLPLGSTKDIGGSEETFEETFYGKYSELIEKIHSVSPLAHIFVQTMHDNLNDRRLEYNEAIKYIADYYSGKIPNGDGVYISEPIHVHVLDLYKYRNLYKIDSIINSKLDGHWNPVGYQQFAEILRRIWSEYINNHVGEFKDVHLV